MKRLLPFTLLVGLASLRGVEIEEVWAQGAVFRQPAAASIRHNESTEWIDFEFYRDSRIFLPVTVNGYETLGVLDSGAAITAIDATVARDAVIEGERTVSASGTGGSVQIQLASDVSVQVGELVLDGLTVGILDLSGVADRLLGRPLPVILGAEFFLRTVVDIDYPNRRIPFRDPDEWEYEGPGDTIALGSNSGSRTVRLRLEDGEPISAGFDIG